MPLCGSYRGVVVWGNMVGLETRVLIFFFKSNGWVKVQLKPQAPFTSTLFGWFSILLAWKLQTLFSLSYPPPRPSSPRLLEYVALYVSNHRRFPLLFLLSLPRPQAWKMLNSRTTCHGGKGL